MKKALFTASTYSHIRTFHLPYLRHFQEMGWSVHLACAAPPEQVPYTDDVLNLPFQKKMSSPSNFRAARLLRKKISKENYTFICTHTSLAAFFTRLALFGMKNRPKVVCMAHGYLFDDETPKLKKKILLTAERLMARYTDLLMTMNCWDHATATRYKLGMRVTKVPGIGVDFSKLSKIDSAQRQIKRRELGLPDNAIVLFYAAEFSSRKSQSILIEAMIYLPSNVYLILAGDGVLRGRCKELASSLELDQRVIFPGYVHDIGTWYGLSDAVVSASRSEGLPFNVMEAMYVGIPVIASAVKGHDDLIEDEETGLLYPYGDTEECARQISRLVSSSALKEKLVQQAGENVLQYGLEQVLPIVIDHYQSVNS